MLVLQVQKIKYLCSEYTSIYHEGKFKIYFSHVILHFAFPAYAA